MGGSSQKVRGNPCDCHQPFDVVRVQSEPGKQRDLGGLRREEATRPGLPSEREPPGPWGRLAGLGGLLDVAEGTQTLLYGLRFLGAVLLRLQRALCDLSDGVAK
jgi:hypothetical protein